MPLYEYHCSTCQREIELLVRGSETPACPACHSTELTRQFSVAATPQVSGSTSGSGQLPLAGPMPGMCGRSACMTGGCQGLGG